MNVLRLLCNWEGAVLDLNKQTYDIGSTPLMVAVGNNDTQIVKALLDMGADLSLKNKSGETALFMAVKRANIEYIRYLLEKGADPNITDACGSTVLFPALSYCRQTDSTFGIDILDELLKAGCDVNKNDNYGISPLVKAVEFGSSKVVKKLVEFGADVNAICTGYKGPRFYTYDFNVSPRNIAVYGAHDNEEESNNNSATALKVLCQFHIPERDVTKCLKCLLKGHLKMNLTMAKKMRIVMLLGYIYLTSKLMEAITGPVNFQWSELRERYYRINFFKSRARENPEVSALCGALLLNKPLIARYFVGNLYVTSSDLFQLPYDCQIRQHLVGYELKNCLKILDVLSSQPPTLFQMAFLKVSSLLGEPEGREERVRELAIPVALQEKLLFRKLNDLKECPEFPFSDEDGELKESPFSDDDD